MACYHPIPAWQCGDGSVVFTDSLRRNDVVRSLELACGQCVGCRLERSRQWAVRCMHEASLHDRNCFITLTYRDAPVGLEYSDFQRFMKRWRAKIAPARLRYYAAGEYGETNRRPHFHAAIFGADFDDKELLSSSAGGERLYRSRVLESLWPAGFSSVGALTFASAAYVARYVMKKVNGDAADSHYWIVDEHGEATQVAPECGHMSKGIGRDWLRLYWPDVLGGKVVVNGHEANAPRYYMKMMKKLRAMDSVEHERHKFAAAHAGDRTDERLAVREEVAKARTNLFKRDKV